MAAVAILRPDRFEPDFDRAEVRDVKIFRLDLTQRFKRGDQTEARNVWKKDRKRGSIGTQFIMVGTGFCRSEKSMPFETDVQCVNLKACKARCEHKEFCRGISWAPHDKNNLDGCAKHNLARCVVYYDDQNIHYVDGTLETYKDYTCYSPTYSVDSRIYEFFGYPERDPTKEQKMVVALNSKHFLSFMTADGFKDVEDVAWVEYPTDAENACFRAKVNVDRTAYIVKTHSKCESVHEQFVELADKSWEFVFTKLGTSLRYKPQLGDHTLQYRFNEDTSKNTWLHKEDVWYEYKPQENPCMKVHISNNGETHDSDIYKMCWMMKTCLDKFKAMVKKFFIGYKHLPIEGKKHVDHLNWMKTTAFIHLDPISKIITFQIDDEQYHPETIIVGDDCAITFKNENSETKLLSRENCKDIQNEIKKFGGIHNDRFYAYTNPTQTNHN